jgi:hypothetical protein
MQADLRRPRSVDGRGITRRRSMDNLRLDLGFVRADQLWQP